MMQKHPLFLVFTFFIQLNLYAQNIDVPLFRGSGGYLSYGLHFVDPSSFNESLEQYSLPAFSSTPMSLSIGGGSFIKGFYLGGQATGQFGLSASNEYYQSHFYGGYGMLKVGYTLLKNSSLAFYPTLGVGGGGSLIPIRAGSFYTHDKEDLLLQPGGSLESSYMLLDLGIHFDFFISSGNTHGGRPIIGVTAGYQFHPLISTWRYQDHTLYDLEEFAPSGIYLKVKVGWGLFL
ncbi:hypothetical protein [Catalinimonas niigatensis]|uniref:hypothetical protein n=1 Tax=Catalinimonas niigatensis TaxID=1397264 RepID=UPI0026661C4B|nr:hypothetical protein [Catalinimonas niigatensis]WPP51938.1 hypothetical protein PZB72_06005 [Catalinimonas niigatensis]